MSDWSRARHLSFCHVQQERPARWCEHVDFCQSDEVIWGTSAPAQKQKYSQESNHAMAQDHSVPLKEIRSTPIRLYLFQLALIEDGTPIPGYLIQTSDGKNILIDTGFPNDDSFLSLDRPPGRGILETTPVVDQLATLGLTPRDIHVLICTHFDPDHSGCHDDFPWSELIVQRAHYEFACAPEHARFALTRPHWDHPSLRYRLVD